MSENTNTESKKITRERSAAYPAIPLEQAVGFSTKLQAAFGKAAFSRENGVKQMGYKSVTGTSGMSVSALVHYGLLNRDGNAYRNSELSIRVAHPIGDEDFNSAIKVAASRPKLYKSLLMEFAGRAVPTALNSILIQSHKISNKVSADVASVFLKTIEYAGLYPNGIVSSDLSEAQDNEEAEDSGNKIRNIEQVMVSSKNGTDSQVAEPRLSIRAAQQKNIPVGNGSYQLADSGSGWSFSLSTEISIPISIKRKLMDALEEVEKHCESNMEKK